MLRKVKRKVTGEKGGQERKLDREAKLRNISSHPVVDILVDSETLNAPLSGNVVVGIETSQRGTARKKTK